MGLLKCTECGNMVSSAALACPKCGAPAPKDMGDAASSNRPISPAAEPAAAPKKSGMGKGCLAALGCTACVIIGGIPVGAGAFFYLMKGRRVEPVVTRNWETPRSVATPREIATLEPAETPIEKPTRPPEAWVTATPLPAATPHATVEPRATQVVRSYATPRPTPVVIAATPRPQPTPARIAVAIATPKPVLAAMKAPASTPLPREEPDAIKAVSTAVAAIPTPKIALATPAPTATPVPVDPNARVIHTLKGDRAVAVNKNIAITGSDGKTVVGVLVNVSNGFVDIRVAGQLLRIGEHDVQDAATY